MAQDEEVVITDADGNDHVFPPGFDPERAAMIVKSHRGQHIVIDKTINALPAAGAAVGGILGAGAGFVGGGPFGAALGGATGAGILGAGGEAARQLINRGRNYFGGEEDVPTNAGDAGTGILKEGLTQAALEATMGHAVPALARGTGKMMYRSALQPINRVLGKYGTSIIDTGIAQRIPVSEPGIEKAGRLLTSRMGEKSAAISAADQNITHLTSGVTQDALAKAAPYARDVEAAGLGNPTNAFTARTDRIKAVNPPGLSPSQLETIKGTIDDQSGLAYRKIRAKEPLTPTERINVDLSHAMGDAQERAVPRYDEMNENIMDAFGLKKAIERRTVGSGGNQGLENLAAILAVAHGMPPLETAAARVGAWPPALSRAGIVTHMIGEPLSAMAAPNAVRAALFDAMSSHKPSR